MIACVRLFTFPRLSTVPSSTKSLSEMVKFSDSLQYATCCSRRYCSIWRLGFCSFASSQAAWILSSLNSCKESSTMPFSSRALTRSIYPPSSNIPWAIFSESFREARLFVPTFAFFTIPTSEKSSMLTKAISKEKMSG